MGQSESVAYGYAGNLSTTQYHGIAVGVSFATASTLQRISVARSAAPHFYQNFKHELDSMELYVSYKMFYKVHNGQVVDATIVRADIVQGLHDITSQFKARLTLNRQYGDEPDGDESEPLREEDIKKVSFANQRCYNVKNSTRDKR